jgi:hypothetical protein
LSARTPTRRIELLRDWEQAEEFIAEVEQDEPETASLLRVEKIELNQSRWGAATPQNDRAPGKG